MGNEGGTTQEILTRKTSPKNEFLAGQLVSKYNDRNETREV